MKNIFWLTASVALTLFCAGASAQDSADIQAVKKRYRAVNDLMSKAQVSESELLASTEGGNVRYYTHAGKLIRISLFEGGESYKADREFTYDENENMVFIFNKITKYNRYLGDPQFDKKKSTTFEERLYFKDKKAIRFLRRESGQKDVALNLKEEQSEIESRWEHAKLIRYTASEWANMQKTLDLKAIKENYRSVNKRMKKAKVFETELLLTNEGEGVTVYRDKGKLIRIIVDNTGETYRAKIELTYDEDEKLNFIFSRLTRYNSQIGDPSLDLSKSRVENEERLYIKDGQTLRYLVNDFDDPKKKNVEASLSKHQLNIQSHLDYAEGVRQGALEHQKSAQP